MEIRDIESAVEAILFASGEPVSISRLSSVLAVEETLISDIADRLSDKYCFERRGIRLIKLDSSLQLCSSPEYADIIRLCLETRRQPQLTGPSIEVLSIVAYFQPVTRAYIEQVRGVDCGYTIGLLTDRGLIEPAGRLQAPGRPMLYKTTQAFLRTFGISSLEELPQLPDIQGEDEDDQIKIQSAIDTYLSQSLAENENMSDNENDKNVE